MIKAYTFRIYPTKNQEVKLKEIDKKLCTPVYDKSGSSVLFGKKKPKKSSIYDKTPVYDKSGSSVLFGKKK